MPIFSRTTSSSSARSCPGLIDFYFACNDLYAYDVAICLNAWCFEKDCSFNLTKGTALLAGYQSVRPLSDDEKAALPMLARGSALRFMLTRLYDWLTDAGRRAGHQARSDRISSAGCASTAASGRPRNTG